jgi:hypothetical protein
MRIVGQKTNNGVGQKTGNGVGIIKIIFSGND